MADWRDGADYAPTKRPFGFAAPRADALEAPVEEPSPAGGRPVDAPRGWTAPDAAPLATLAPRQATHRDPREAFDTDSAAFRGQSAWGSDAPQGWTPTQPLQVSGENPAVAPWGPPAAPAPVVDAGMPPVPLPTAAPTGQPIPAPVAGRPPVPYPGQMGPAGQPLAPPQGNRSASTPLGLVPLDAILLGCLLIGLVAQPLSVPAIVAAWLVGRSRRPQRAASQRTLVVGLAVAVVLGLLDVLTEGGYEPAWSTFNAFGRLECLVLMAVLAVQMLVQRDA